MIYVTICVILCYNIVYFIILYIIYTYIVCMKILVGNWITVDQTETAMKGI